MDIKLQEVMAGCAQEYLEPLANLQENMQIRTKVAGESKQYTRIFTSDFVDRDRIFFLECISPLFLANYGIAFFLQLKVKSLILAASC